MCSITIVHTMFNKLYNTINNYTQSLQMLTSFSHIDMIKMFNNFWQSSL